VIARSQRGQAVRGSVMVSRAGSRLRVEVLARPAVLGRRGRTQMRIGSSTKTAPAGTASFNVNLNSTAKRALRRRGRLPVTVRITVTPPSGTPFTSTQSVTLRR
jgi:hypothetical protein